jgi:PAS domain-containing protein
MAAGLTNAQIQLSLLGEAIAEANVGFLVWDDARRYVAVNARACELLGCSLETIIGSRVGSRTVDGETLVRKALRDGGLRGQVTVERFDGSGTLTIDYVTFMTRTAGLPYMASLIWPAEEL